MGKTDLIVVTTTTENQEEALRIAKTMIEKRLAACSQVEGPIESIYRWQGKVDSTQEWRLTLKTIAANYPLIKKEIKAIHSYNLPEIIATQITHGCPEYLSWIEANSEGVAE